jgi:hypothetical protein
VAWQLTDAGYAVELDVWDWAAGENFVTAISDTLARCDRVLALFSAAYFDRSRYTTEEWSAAALHVPGSWEQRLVPVRVLTRLGGSGPRLPGSLPRVWNIPARNAGFTGRDGLLVAVRELLLAGDKAVVQALAGMGGVGKTQLAIEYAHRFAGSYDLAWWVDSEQGGLIGDQFAALGRCVGRCRARDGSRGGAGQQPRRRPARAGGSR